MKKIVKISENVYLVNGTHLTNDFNNAVIVANENCIIPNFYLESKEMTFWNKVKLIFNYPFWEGEWLN